MYYMPDTSEQSMAGDYSHIIMDSQLAWRQVQRGVLSRPMEMSWLDGPMDSLMKHAYLGYISSDFPRPLYTWSVLEDKPLQRYKYHNSIRVPSHINSSDVAMYRDGIKCVDEWVTRELTIDLIDRLVHRIITPEIVEKYRSLYPKRAINSYSQMVHAVAPGLRMKNDDVSRAIKIAYFVHRFDELHDILSQGTQGKLSTVDELAVAVGRKMSDEGGVLVDPIAYLRDQPVDDRLTRFRKRIYRSVYQPGHAEYQPGVVELVVASTMKLPLATLSLGAIVSTLTGLPIELQAIQVSIFSALESFGLFDTLAHESHHAYSGSETYLGLMPRDIRVRE